MDDLYDEWLDEALGEVKIGTLTYQASRVLKEVDPTAYRCGFGDFTDSMGDGALNCEDCGEPLRGEEIYNLGMDDRPAHEKCPEGGKS
jgi:hypothetical protein